LKVSDRFKHQYKKYTRSYLPSEITQNNRFESGIDDIFFDLSELATQDVCLARKKALGVDCQTSDLAERVLRLSNGDEIIAGARFKNLDVSFPFVEICKTSEAKSEMLAELQKLVALEFRNIRPKGFKFRDRPGLDLSLEKWSHTVFGKIESKIAMPDLPDINAFFSKSLNWHSKYCEEYRERLNEKKELNGFVRIGELDEFEEAASNDSLLVLTDDHIFAGVIAGTDCPIYGLSAIYMIESYLSKRWVGKRIAPLAHSIFFNGLASRYQYVWGTIYDQNLSSLNTALRTGRKVIETEYFCSVVNHPNDLFIS
jgi:hypothetical protein